MKYYSPTGQLRGAGDILGSLVSSEGAQIHLYHHVSISDTILTVVAGGLGMFLLTSVLKYRRTKKS